MTAGVAGDYTKGLGLPCDKCHTYGDLAEATADNRCTGFLLARAPAILHGRLSDFSSEPA
jgi:hypothetical protein